MNAVGMKNKCRNAGRSELYIVHVLDSFVVIALQHNSGSDTRSSSVSVTLSTLPPNPRLLGTHTQMERNGEGTRRRGWSAH